MKARFENLRAFISTPVMVDFATFMFCAGMLLGMAVSYAAVVAAAG